MAIADLRKHYTRGTLDRKDLQENPVAQFKEWFEQAKPSGNRLWKIAIGFYKWLQIVFGANPIEPNVMTLATADKDGHPSARIVLLKGIDERGFIFYTNYESRKGKELTENPWASLVFYWSELERQVCVSGSIAKLSADESEVYFKSRPRVNQLGAWASTQSSVVKDRSELEQQFKDIEQKFGSGNIPMPPYWGGYVLKPQRIEFWQGRLGRLHDRFCYTLEADGKWSVARLSP